MATTTKTHQKWRRDLVRGKVVRVADSDDLWVEPDFFAPWNGFPYAHFAMMKLRLHGVDAVERDHPLWHDAVADLEDRVLGGRVDVEIVTFDHHYNRFLARVWLRTSGRRGAKVTVDPRYVKKPAGKKMKPTSNPPGKRVALKKQPIVKAKGMKAISSAGRPHARSPRKPKKGMSTGAKVGLAVVVLGGLALGAHALLGGGDKPTA